MEEITIKVKDLLLRILLKWRPILLCMIIFALAFNFLAYYRAKKAAAITVSSKEESLKDNLTEDELKEAERVAVMYKVYQKNYDDTVNYMDGSIKMNLDPSDICTNVLQYRVDTKYSVTYPEIEKKDYTKDILNSFYYKLVNDANCSEMARNIGENIRTSYIKELIGFSVNEDILNISVMGRSYEECDKITDILRRETQSVAETLKQQYGDFDFYDMGLHRFKSFNQDVLNAQRNQANTLRDVRAASTGLLDSLSEKQRQYLLAVLEEKEEETDLATETQIEEEHTQESDEVRLIRPKMILVGAAAGFLLCVLFYLCRLLLARRLISDDTIKRAYGIESLGNIRVSGQPSGLFSFVDRALIRIFGSDSSGVAFDDKLDMISAGIRIMAQKKGLKNLYITGSSLDEGTAGFIEKIKEKLEKDIESVRCGRSIVQDPQSLEDMSGADSLIMVEREDYSSLVEIDREYALCRQNQVPVLGYITLL